MTKQERAINEALRRLVRLHTGIARLPPGTEIQGDHFESLSGGPYCRSYGRFEFRYEIPPQKQLKP